MGFVLVVGVVVMSFVAGCGCCCDGFFFFFSSGGDGGGWQWVAGCEFLFMIMASGTMWWLFIIILMSYLYYFK